MLEWKLPFLAVSAEESAGELFLKLKNAFQNLLFMNNLPQMIMNKVLLFPHPKAHVVL